VLIFVSSYFLLGERNRKCELSLMGNLFDINIIHIFEGYVKHTQMVQAKKIQEAGNIQPPGFYF
jgi:hypothetical protein